MSRLQCDVVFLFDWHFLCLWSDSGLRENVGEGGNLRVGYVLRTLPVAKLDSHYNTHGTQKQVGLTSLTCPPEVRRLLISSFTKSNSHHSHRLSQQQKTHIDTTLSSCNPLAFVGLSYLEFGFYSGSFLHAKSVKKKQERQG